MAMFVLRKYKADENRKIRKERGNEEAGICVGKNFAIFLQCFQSG